MSPHRATNDSIGKSDRLLDTLYHPSVPNLLTAGRCLSAADDLWNVTRVIPVCAVSGEAAGTAAALGSDFAAMDVSRLQSRLRAQGVRIHIEEL